MGTTLLDGETLMILRRRRGLRQRELGELIGLGPAVISCYERGTRRLTAERQREFLRILAGGTVEVKAQSVAE